MRVLITGGAGFIGSHLAERLSADGHAVRIVDNLSTGRLENLATFAERVEFIKGDVRDAALMDELARGCELVYHEAAIVSVPYSVEHPQESHDINLQGTLNVLLAARTAGVRRVVFACSAAVYGDEPELPVQESARPFPTSPYGLEKLTAEHYCRLFHALYGLETVALRYFNVFGPRQDPRSPYSGVISIFADRIRAGEQPTVFGDGKQTRDFVFVEDVVQANLLAGTTAAAAGCSYNIGRGEATTLQALLQMLARVTGRRVEARYADPRPGDIVHSCADITRAREQLGYQPTVDVEEGLRRLLAA